MSDAVKRDIRDPKEGWILVYEDRNGGYVGRKEISLPMHPTDSMLLSPMKLSDVACFEERILHANGFVPAGPEQAAVTWGPAQFLREVWVFGANPKIDTIVIPTSRIVQIVPIADMSTFLQDVWARALDACDELRRHLTQEANMGGPSILTVVR
jgi:hypothetical protein